MFLILMLSFFIILYNLTLSSILFAIKLLLLKFKAFFFINMLLLFSVNIKIARRASYNCFKSNALSNIIFFVKKKKLSFLF